MKFLKFFAIAFAIASIDILPSANAATLIIRPRRLKSISLESILNELAGGSVAGSAASAGSVVGNSNSDIFGNDLQKFLEGAVPGTDLMSSSSASPSEMMGSSNPFGGLFNGMLNDIFGGVQSAPAAHHSDPFSMLNDILDPYHGQHHHMPQTANSLVANTHMKENDTQLAISVALPGFSLSEIQVSVHENELTITGDHKCPEGNDSLEWCEPRAFAEMFTLSKAGHYALKETTVKYENGMLRLTVPKTPDEQPVDDEKRVLQIQKSGDAVIDGASEPGKLKIQFV